MKRALIVAAIAAREKGVSEPFLLAPPPISTAATMSRGHTSPRPSAFAASRPSGASDDAALA